MAEQLSLFEAEEPDPPEPKPSAAAEVGKAVKKFEMTAKETSAAFEGVANIFRGLTENLRTDEAIKGKGTLSIGGEIIGTVDAITLPDISSEPVAITRQYLGNTIGLNSDVGISREPMEGDLRWDFETYTMEAFEGTNWLRLAAPRRELI